MKNENKQTPISITNHSQKGQTDEKSIYRTKRKATNAADIPDRLPVITNSAYQHALTFFKNDTAYLQAISPSVNFKYKDGMLLFKGLPISSAELENLYTEECLDKINLSLLRALYGILLNIFDKSQPMDQMIDSAVTIYYPEFAKKTGKSSNIGKNDVNEFIKNMKQLQTVIGIINNGSGGCDISPAIIYLGHDPEKNTISFCSPYMVKIISNIHKASIKRDKTGKPLLKKNGEPQMLPAYSYLTDMAITKEKNKKAVEIVLIVVALIEQSGNNTPHIKVQTIVDRNRLLYESLREQRAGSKNILLSRAFKKAWELLNTKTYLSSVYKNIQLPNPEDISAIPTSSTLNMVFKFPHKGK